ncbi:mannitol dehydrogenase family protein [Noviherbaspirillum saxi]|uniref:Mannitol dehydrogenase family protein n=1 Tax=Noviherbaspirillum saxi TaxID=2320863 RepID=A0A3A3FGQ7_9BURK|nr:mannitol dehydrogenase family protein [Noviherbaspirillum saxi]RJF92317.1 mannitol dehydrogenase family protein [Noviherbaspirillum saxi]
MPELLSLRTLPKLAPAIRPGYDPAALRSGIVHLGSGAFHRAHQALYTEIALASGSRDWGIIGASLRQASAGTLLRAQDGLYSVLTKGESDTSIRVIGCVREVIYTPDDPRRLPALIGSAETRIVSLTVTEKGYTLEPATRALDFSHPDIAHDLRAPEAPTSAVGTLFAGLHARRLAHGQPLTVMSCDNLQHNGKVLRRLVLAFAEAVDKVTAQWIVANVCFPDTMVDRIVPATTTSTLQEVRELLGVEDRAAVWGEPFRQWVIQDNFGAGRPMWEAGGAQIVADVQPFEEMKLRLLNSSNSMLAYLGYLGGDEYIYQAMRAPSYATLVRRFMKEEAAPTLSPVPGQDLDTYQAQLLERFANSSLPHRCYQIAMDGSQKLPQRLLSILRDNLAAGRPIRLGALGLAAWMRYVSGIDEQGKPILVQDPIAGQLEKMARSDPSDIVDRVLSIRSMFGDNLPQSQRLRNELIAALDHLQRYGSRTTVAAYAERR